MKQINMLRQILLFLLVLLTISCSNSNKEELINLEEIEWNKIKNSSDFSLFLNFVLRTNDTILFNQCADSLDRIVSKNKDNVLHYIEYYNFDNDSLISIIEFEDMTHKCVDYWKRNVLDLSIETDGIIRAYYRDSLLSDYKNELIYLFETNEISYDVPDVRTLSYKGKEYDSKNLVVFIYTKTYPQTSNEINPWRSIVNIVNSLEETILIVKDNKAKELFNSSYRELEGDQKNIIDGIIPLRINIYSEPKLIPPPPLPITQD